MYILFLQLKLYTFVHFFTKKMVHLCSFFFTTKIAELRSLTILIQRKYVILIYQMIFYTALYILIKCTLNTILTLYYNM